MEKAVLILLTSLWKIDGEAVGANLHGTPVVCGGYSSGTYYQTCYKYTNTGWQQFASMKEKRGYFEAGVMHKNKFHVLWRLWWLKLIKDNRAH